MQGTVLGSSTRASCISVGNRQISKVPSDTIIYWQSRLSSYTSQLKPKIDDQNLPRFTTLHSLVFSTTNTSAVIPLIARICQNAAPVHEALTLGKQPVEWSFNNVSLAHVQG